MFLMSHQKSHYFCCSQKR